MADYTDIDKLRELAEAATPGPWKWSVSVDRQWALVETAEDNLRILAQLPDDDDAAFIAACSPDVILALVAELVGLRTEVDQLRTDNERLTACCNAHQRDVDEWAAEQAEASRKSLALMDDIADLRERLEVSANLSTYPAAEAMNQAERIAQYLESEGLAVRVPVVDDALRAERDAALARVDQLRTENDDRRDALREVDAERDAALARAVRAEQALLGVRKTLDALCEPTRLTHPTRLRSALDAFLAAVPLVGAEEPKGETE